MRISLIVAMGTHRQIGWKNQIPWKLPSDLKNFKKVTLGHTLLMGRTTFESIGKPLPGRKTILLTRNPSYEAKSCLIAGTLKEAFQLAKEHQETELFIAGGSQIYKEALPYVERFYFSFVDYEGDADTYFPEFSLEGWTQHSTQKYPQTNTECSWTYEIWDKEKP